jgi:hypothetical protein
VIISTMISGPRFHDRDKVGQLSQAADAPAAIAGVSFVVWWMRMKL